jgi:hypothetical protein
MPCKEEEAEGNDEGYAVMTTRGILHF